MPKEVLTAIIAAAAAVLGGLLTAWASANSTRHKIKELQLQHLQDRRATYLTNARAHVTPIYIPLQASITRLVLRFEEYRRSTPEDSEVLLEQREAAFRDEIVQFVSDTHKLLHSGADAFLTTELSEALRSFLSFLQSSIDAHEAREKVLFSYDVDLPGIRLGGSRQNVFASAKVEQLVSRSISVGVVGIGFTVQRSEIVEAPIISPEFEKRFMSDSILLRGHIKEVTLGSRALPD